jgi:hypothetical protein
LKKQLDDLLLNMGGGANGGGKRSHNEDSGAEDNSAELNKLRMEMNILRDDTQTSLKGMQDALFGKASKEDLGELEAKIINMINEMLKRLLSQFADKKET